MSKLKDICVSLGTAKALVEVGIVVDSYFCWARIWWENGCMEKEELMSCNDLLPYQMEQSDLGYTIEQCPAPTFEELDPPDMIVKDGKGYKLSIRKSLNHWVISYNNLYDQNDVLTDPEYSFTNEHSLCNTMAEVMIQLKKKELI